MLNPLINFVLSSAKKTTTTLKKEEVMNSLESDGLSLSLMPEVNDVSFTGHCAIKVNGQNVKLKTKEYYEEYEMPLSSSSSFKSGSVIVNVNEDLRKMLDQLETAVKERLPEGLVYKHLYRGDKLCVKVSRFCKYYVYDALSKTLKPSTLSSTDFKQGHYIFILRVPNLFVGDHRGGADCSLCIELDAVYYRPDEAAIEREKTCTPWNSKFAGFLAVESKTELQQMDTVKL